MALLVGVAHAGKKFVSAKYWAIHLRAIILLPSRLSNKTESCKYKICISDGYTAGIEHC